MRTAMDKEASMVAAARRWLSARGDFPVNRQMHDQIMPSIVARPATFDSTSARTTDLAKDQRLQSRSGALSSATTSGHAFTAVSTNCSDHLD
jgi:hypothetical protein